MSRDGERVIELMNELGTRISHVLTDMVPPRAQVHLLNAQRELITALMLIYEHQATARRPERGGEHPTIRRRTATRAAAPRRVRKIDID
jgi:hypothetical protein